jgi:hypothetical protein
LQKFEEKEALLGEKLPFSGVAGKDVYNITAPFEISLNPGGKLITVIAGRVEEREAIAESQILFFTKREDVWVPVIDAPTFQLEDGFVVQIKGETIFGGVQVYPKPTDDNPNAIGWRTVFHRGFDLLSLKDNQFAVGPDGMKDIRLIALGSGQIGVFTRPQGGSNGAGKIGYVEIKDLSGLNNLQVIQNASIIEDQFAFNEWGGANDLHLLPDGQIEVIGHIAYQDEQGAKHYYAMTFVYNPKTHMASPIEIIATRKNFPGDEAKRPELKDIVFPSCLIRHSDGTGTLYVGLSDATAGKLELSDSFV